MTPVGRLEDGPTSSRPVAHFMIRVTLPDDSGMGEVSGLVERLGTGEKQPFTSGEHLLRLVRDWPDPVA